MLSQYARRNSAEQYARRTAKKAEGLKGSEKHSRGGCPKWSTSKNLRTETCVKQMAPQNRRLDLIDL